MMGKDGGRTGRRGAKVLAENRVRPRVLHSYLPSLSCQRTSHVSTDSMPVRDCSEKPSTSAGRSCLGTPYAVTRTTRRRSWWPGRGPRRAVPAAGQAAPGHTGTAEQPSSRPAMDPPVEGSGNAGRGHGVFSTSPGCTWKEGRTASASPGRWWRSSRCRTSIARPRPPSSSSRTPPRREEFTAGRSAELHPVPGRRRGLWVPPLGRPWLWPSWLPL